VLCVACGLVPLAAWAGPGEPPGGLDVRLGFGGIVKIGVPLPLDIALPPLGGTGPAELVVDAPALGPDVGLVVTSTVVLFQAVAGAPQTIHVSVVISDPRRPLVIRVSINGQEVHRRAVPISPEQVGGRLLVALSDEHAGLASLHRLPGRVEVAYLNGNLLPRVWQEYAAVDLLVARDLNPLALDATQQEALRTWIHLGGRLLVIARPRMPVPPFLEPMLPAAGGPPRTLTALPALTAAYGGTLSAGPFTVTALLPRAGVQRMTEDDLTVMASSAAGRGRVMVWGVDMWEPPFVAWSGRFRLWDDAIRTELPPLVDPVAVAEKLTVGTPLDPLVHAEVGGAILAYLAALLGLLRWRPSLVGAAMALGVVLLGLGGFMLLAETTRARSATLTQVTVLEPVSPLGASRATTVAAVAVPYGGRYRVTVARGMITQPITPSSNLRIEMSRAGTALTGVLRPGEPARPFQAAGIVPIPASASFSADGHQLRVDLGRLRAHHVELRARDRVYPLGDLPAGRSVIEIRPDGWVAAASDGRTLSELSQHVRDAIFQAPPPGAILNDTPPMLVGELDWAASVFILAGTAAPGQRLTILLVPLERT
jgi:hypothetical protein